MNHLQLLAMLFFVASSTNLCASYANVEKAKKEMRSAHSRANDQTQKYSESSKSVDRYATRQAGKNLDSQKQAIKKTK